MLPLAVYLGFFQDYFSSHFTLVGILVTTLAIVLLGAAFGLSRNSSVKTYSLLFMMASSSFLWLFAISSLILCSLMAEEYWYSPGPTVSVVLRLSLLITLAGGPSLILLFRGRAISKVYNRIQGSAIPSKFFENSPTSAAEGIPSLARSVYERTLRIFSSVRAKAAGSNREHGAQISLSLLRGEGAGLPDSVAVDWRNNRMVAIKQDIVNLLEDDELEGVLAHELGHLERRDARSKSIATAFRISFPFDPVVYFAEAAIYRERELAADEYSAKLTGRPASLASALLKIYKNMRSTSVIEGLDAPAGISFLLSVKAFGDKSNQSLNQTGTRRSPSASLLSKEPPLKQRIERLLAITNSMKDH